MKKFSLFVLTALILFAFLNTGTGAARSYEEQLGEIARQYDIPADSISEITLRQVIDIVKSAFKNSVTAPLRLTLKLALIITAACGAKAFISKSGNMGEDFADMPVFGILFLNLIGPVKEIVKNITSDMVDTRNFMSAFLPVFGGISMASGEFFSSALYTGLLMGGMIFFSRVCINIILPSVNLYFVFTAAGSVFPDDGIKNIGNIYVKAVKAVMKTIVTAICFLLTFQTSLTQSKDTLAVKAGKFISGSAIPVIGSALQDAVAGVYAGMETIKSFAGIVGVAGVSYIFLPTAALLAVYWLCAGALGILCDIFGSKSGSYCIKGFTNAIEISISVVILFQVMLIFSIAVILIITKGV